MNGECKEMTFIELHFCGHRRLINVDKISAVGHNSNETFIWLDGNENEIYVDESYDYVTSALMEVGFIWNE